MDSPFYEAKLAFDKLARWIKRPSLRIHRPSLAVMSKISSVGSASLSWRHALPTASGRLSSAFRAGVVDAYRLHHPEPGRYTWWDYRAGNFMNFGMRIDHLLVTTALQNRVVWAEIDREARKGKPVPSDHPASHRPRQARHSSMPAGLRRNRALRRVRGNSDEPDLFSCLGQNSR